MLRVSFPTSRQMRTFCARKVVYARHVRTLYVQHHCTTSSCLRPLKANPHRGGNTRSRRKSRRVHARGTPIPITSRRSLSAARQLSQPENNKQGGFPRLWDIFFRIFFSCPLASEKTKTREKFWTVEFRGFRGIRLFPRDFCRLIGKAFALCETDFLANEENHCCVDGYRKFTWKDWTTDERAILVYRFKRLKAQGNHLDYSKYACLSGYKNCTLLSIAFLDKKIHQFKCIIEINYYWVFIYM